MKHTLIIATQNRGKLDEFRELLVDLPLEVVGVSDVLRVPPVVIEDGRTFTENALKKALAVARATSTLTLADDSGLEVDALDGAPGVRSARYAHERATDAENNAALLKALDSVTDPMTRNSIPPVFSARFRCVLALVDPFSPAASPHVVEGVCEGAVVRQARGSGGFGYDPLFVVGDLDRAMAELTTEEKNRASHRGRAVLALRPHLSSLLERRQRELERIAGA